MKVKNSRFFRLVFNAEHHYQNAKELTLIKISNKTPVAETEKGQIPLK